LTFLVALYFAVVFHAEKDFLSGKVLHFDLSGLIKVITLGSFDNSSRVKEQNESQVNVARKNIIATVCNPEFETLSIITASGWDLFGEGMPLKGVEPPKPIVIDPNDSWWKRAYQRWKNSRLERTIKNGYLLESISERYRKVRIILLDPHSDGAVSRAQGYMDGEHKVIEQVGDYKKNINIVLNNLRSAYQRNKNIEVKLVKTIPQWKLLLVEGEAWAQPILTGLRSDHTPLYGFLKSEYSLYHTFWNLHETIWHSAEAVSFDLSSAPIGDRPTGAYST
jgi:hypothetical protein